MREGFSLSSALRGKLEKKDSENLQHISDTLDKVLVVLNKPANKGVRAFEIGGAVVGVLGIIHIFETILKWIFGG